MSFSNTQLIKNMILQLLQIRKKIIKHVIFKYATDKKLCYHDYFYDIINPQK